jgi:peptidoglycan/LPS O-acetylase OafA/YrhL
LKTTKKKLYSPEIDSLRAIAVISVILYHANVIIFNNELLNGGFVGVDVFIVISGFVITKLFFNQNFSYIEFLERRARRLLPPLLLVIVITSIFSYFLLLPQHFSNLGQSIVGNIFFISNFLFLYQSNYWDPLIFTKPLLHTWSLSLEFQFYIFICIIFWLFKKNIIKIVTFFFLSSLVLLFFGKEFNFYYNFRELALNNYFLIFARLWEFLTGSLIAIILSKKNYLENLKIKNYLKNIGLILILISVLLINTPKNYPSLLTFMPVLGASMILLGNNKKNNHFILNNSTLIHLGKMSYSLYLWHFPILIFFLYNLSFELDVWQKLYILLIIYLFSFGSYKFIETPFFKKNILTRKNFFILIIITSIIVLFLGLLIAKLILKPRSSLKYEEIIKTFPNYNFLQLPERNLLKNQFTNNKKIKILICGDSHGFDLALTLQSNEYIKRKYEIEFLGFYDCFKKESSLIEKTDYVFSSIQINKKLYNTFGDIKKLHEIITIDYNKKFVIVGATTEFKTDNDLLLNFLTINNFNKEDIKKNITKINEYFFKNKKEYTKNINSSLREISKELNVIFLDKFDYICEEKNNICYGVDFEARNNFFDYSHYTNNGAIFFGNIIAKTNWLKLNY